MSRDPTVRFSGEGMTPVDRIFGSSSKAGTQRRVRRSVLILLVFLLTQAHTSKPLPRFCRDPDMGRPDTDDGDNITRLSAGDINRPGFRAVLTRLGLSGSFKSPAVSSSDRSPSFSNLTPRASPASPFGVTSFAVRPLVALSAVSILTG